MATNKTSFLNLNDWAGSDPFKREEINANFRALDAKAKEHDDSINDVVTVNAKQKGSVQSALNAIKSGGTLLFPPGQYDISNLLSVTFDSGANVRIIGVGNVVLNSTVPEQALEIGILQLIGGSTGSITIKNISLVHSGTTLGTLDGITLAGFGKASLNNVSVKGATFWGVKLTSCLGGVISECDVSNNFYAGLGMQSCENITVIGGKYNYNGTTAPTNGYGISCKTSTTNDNKNILITGVHACYNKRKGIDVHNGQNIRILGNFSIGNDYGGIYAVNEGGDKTVKDVTIANNYVDMAGNSSSDANISFGVSVGAFGATSSYSGQFIITGNIIKNVKVIAIVVSSPDSGGIAPKKVIINSNVIENGSATNYAIIKNSSTTGPNIDEVIINGNSLHSATTSNAIQVSNVNKMNVSSNVITVDSGTVSWGVNAASTVYLVCIGNQLLGGATYSFGFPVSAATALQINKGNFMGTRQHRDSTGGISEEFASAPIASTYYYKGSKVWNSAPTAGGTAFWLCLANGYYCATAWTASTPCSVSQQRYANGYVYECTVSGTSGTTAPSATSGTVTDGTVTWKVIGALGVFETRN